MRRVNCLFCKYSFQSVLLLVKVQLEKGYMEWSYSMGELRKSTAGRRYSLKKCGFRKVRLCTIKVPYIS